MKWFFNLPVKQRALICSVPLFIFIICLIAKLEVPAIVFLLLFGISMIFLAYSEKLDKEKQKAKQTSANRKAPIEAFKYDLLIGQGSRKTLPRRIFWKDGCFRFPYPTIVTLKESKQTYDVLVNGLKIGAILPEDVSSIKEIYNRIYQLSIEVDHEDYSQDYLPWLYVECYTDEKYKSIPNYCYRPRGQRVSQMLSPTFLDEYIVIDTETTGLDSRYNDILEVAAIHIKDGEIIDTFSELCYSDKISDKTASINHITIDMVQSARKVWEVVDDFTQFIGDLPIIGHNVDFDISFISSINPISNKFDDTCILADEFMMGRQNSSIQLENRKLGTVCSALDVQYKDSHRALDDCTATYQCYEKLKVYINNILKTEIAITENKE